MKSLNTPIVFIDDDEQEMFEETDYLTPETHYSPKDKVSNLTWANRFPIGIDAGVRTIKRNEDFGCIVHLDYEKIIKSSDVVTGAELSHFDRSVYDAVSTIYATGNKFFTTVELLRVITQNPKAKLTEKKREQIRRSLFHIARFWMTITTDDSEKLDVWYKLSSRKPLNYERKIYKNLQATYTGRLLNFSVIGYRVSEGEPFEKKEEFAEVWKILDTPILYKYAKAKGQISAVPIKFLDTSKKADKKIALNRGDHTDELANFLSREIDTMKKTAKRKQPYSRIILLERIYQIDGIEDIQQNSDNVRTKKKTTRQKLVKILDRFKENGFIKKYELHKKVKKNSLYFHSVEIIF